MNFETLLQMLHEEREEIAQNLDEASRNQLIQHLESYLSSGEPSTEFFIFYGKNFSNMTKSERFTSKDKGKLTPIDVEKFANEVIKALKQPSPKKNEKNIK